MAHIVWYSVCRPALLVSRTPSGLLAERYVSDALRSGGEIAGVVCALSQEERWSSASTEGDGSIDVGGM
jgi:hypothetical protein